VGQSGQVLVVDDDRFTASLLAEALTGAGWSVLGPAHDVAGALALVERETSLDAALLDLDLGPGPDGIDVAVALRQRFPAIGLVVLTAYRTPRLFRPDRYEVPVGVRLVSKADVRDIALIDAELRAAIVAPHAINPGAMTPAVTVDGVQLTDRQVLVMRLVADGLSNAAIADRVGIAEASVEKAVARLIRRLELSVEDGGNPRVLLARAYDRLARPQSGR
jgi:DNA-binding NarL/FixJ family response regulator